MKKLSLLALALIMVIGANAQKIGVKAGGNMSGYLINFWSPEGSKMSTGLNFGLVGEYELSDAMALRVDLGLNQLGSDYDSRDETDANWAARPYYEYDYVTNINYLHLAISPKFNFGPAYAFVGPYFEYALSSAVKTTITPTTGDVQEWTVNVFDDPSTDFDYTKPFSDDNNLGGTGDLLNKMDFGLNLGLGADFNGVFVELNAGMGLMNYINTESQYYVQEGYATADDVTVALTDKATQKNIFFGLSVGYMFGGE